MEDGFGRVGPEDGERRHCWALTARGGLALIAGVVLLAAPLGGLAALVVLVATLFAVDGLIALLLGVWNIRSDRQWWVTVLQGIASLAIATLALSWPAATLLSMVWLTAAWAIWQGITEMMMARTLMAGPWLAVGGMVSVVLGIGMIALPAIGAFSLVIVIAVYAIVRGVYLLAAAFRARHPYEIN